MVIFKLIEESEDRLVYWYFPEGHEDKKPGVIVVDRVREEIKIIEVAEEDWERDIPPEEMNELVEAINQMKHERGDSDFIELVTEPEHSIYYGDHAVREIVKHLREGLVPNQGEQVWY